MIDQENGEEEHESLARVLPDRLGLPEAENRSRSRPITVRTTGC